MIRRVLHTILCITSYQALDHRPGASCQGLVEKAFRILDITGVKGSSIQYFVSHFTCPWSHTRIYRLRLSEEVSLRSQTSLFDEEIFWSVPICDNSPFFDFSLATFLLNIARHVLRVSWSPHFRQGEGTYDIFCDLYICCWQHGHQYKKAPCHNNSIDGVNNCIVYCMI